MLPKKKKKENKKRFVQKVNKSIKDAWLVELKTASILKIKHYINECLLSKHVKKLHSHYADHYKKQNSSK